MYKCMVTNKITRPGTKLNRIVVQSRPKVYTEWFREDGEWVELEVGRGYEIVKEIQVSDEGLRMFESMSLEERNDLLHRLGIPGQFGMQQ